MAKIHPLLPQSSSSSCSCSNSNSSETSYYTTSKKETFTIWMKSLVMQTNGCTVYNENGQIVYRVDNYDQKGSSEVYLMDLQGTVLFTIRKLWFFKQWKGYRSDGLKSKSEKPFFQVRKNSRILKRNLCIRSANGCYNLEASAGKSAFKILNRDGGLVAKATRKQTPKGVILGDDVLELVVEPQVDHSFIMALVTVYGLIHHRL